MGHREAVEKECFCWTRAGEDAPKHFDPDCEECEGTGLIKVPGVFHAFCPTRIEKVVDEDVTEEEVEKLRKRGITPVIVKRVDENGNQVDEDGNLLFESLEKE